MTSFYGFFILFLQFLQFFLFFSAFLHTILSHHYISLPSLFFFFTLCMSLFLYCTLSHLACNSWFFLSISWSARFLCVSIITALYACHHFSEPKLYIGPYFLQVFLLLLCFSVFVFCFVIKYSQFCIFPLGVLENTLHFSLCFFLLFPLFLFSAFQCYFVVLHQTLLATLLLFFPMSWSLHCSIQCISSCCSFSLCISVFFAVHFFKLPLSPAPFLLSECVDSLFPLSLAGTPVFNQELPVHKRTSSSSTHHQLVTACSTIASLALGSLVDYFLHLLWIPSGILVCIPLFRGTNSLCEKKTCLQENSLVDTRLPAHSNLLCNKTSEAGTSLNACLWVQKPYQLWQLW